MADMFDVELIWTKELVQGCDSDVMEHFRTKNTQNPVQVNLIND